MSAPDSAPAAERPPGVAHLAYALGAASALGGVAGFVRANSARSLVGGGLLAAALGYGGHLIATPGSQERGFRLAAGASGVLALVMGARYARTRALVPAGALALAGGASAAYHGLKWSEWAA